MTENDRTPDPAADSTADEAPPEPADPSGRLARRALLGGVALVTVGGLAGAALGASGKHVPLQASVVPPAAPPVRPAASPSPTPTARPAASAAPHPDHEAAAQAAVKAFPAKTQGTGLQPLAGTVVNGVREFELTCSEIDWEVAPGQRLKALAYNGQVPGPIIRVTEGEPIRVKVTNKMDQTTGVHFHGQRTPNNVDGVPYLTQPPIKPGETYAYEFVAKPAGSHMYHSHHNATEQVGRGLLGPLLVMPKDPASEPKYDKDELFVLNDALGGFTVNGKGFPATAPYVAKLGQRIRFRFMNEGNMSHPVHLHGFPMLVFARDGYALPQPFLCDTLDVAPGQRWDAIVTADEPGAWAFHCHILTHAEGSQGMFGMVTALVVEK